MNRALGTDARSILVIDVGGTRVKVLASGKQDPRKIPSGQSMTASRMVKGEGFASGRRRAPPAPGRFP